MPEGRSVTLVLYARATAEVAVERLTLWAVPPGRAQAYRVHFAARSEAA